MEEKELIINFINIARPILISKNFQSLRNYTQHGQTSTYDHVLNVAFLAYKKATSSKRNYDLESLVKGCLLHDYYLYDWHLPKKEVGRTGLHGFKHPRASLNNVVKEFEINKKIKNMILSHMWPLTLFHIPLSKEAWLLTRCDKKISMIETRNSLTRIYNEELHNLIQKEIFAL